MSFLRKWESRNSSKNLDAAFAGMTIK